LANIFSLDVPVSYFELFLSIISSHAFEFASPTHPLTRTHALSLKNQLRYGRTAMPLPEPAEPADPSDLPSASSPSSSAVSHHSLHDGTPASSACQVLFLMPAVCQLCANEKEREDLRRAEGRER
jgi:hypothetical protein